MNGVILQEEKKQKQCKNERALNVYKNVPSSDLQKEKNKTK